MEEFHERCTVDPQVLLFLTCIVHENERVWESLTGYVYYMVVTLDACICQVSTTALVTKLCSIVGRLSLLLSKEIPWSFLARTSVLEHANKRTEWGEV